jgi:hypothetical protein
MNQSAFYNPALRGLRQAKQRGLGSKKKKIHIENLSHSYLELLYAG